jgi:hypothetical protein
MGLTGSLSRGFLYGLNYMEVTGLDGFLETLDRRGNIEGRERGLITGMASFEDYRKKMLIIVCVCLPTHR